MNSNPLSLELRSAWHAIVRRADRRRSRRWWITLVVTASTCAATGCISLPSYDSKTDELLTNLQKDTDTFIATLSNNYDATTADKKACAYAANVKTYQGFKLDIGLLRTRASALYDNEATVAALNKLQGTYDTFEAAHKAADARADHCILPALLTADQQAMDSAIGSLLKLELAKKGSS